MSEMQGNLIITLRSGHFIYSCQSQQA